MEVCQTLGIDDPVHWMNNTEPEILNLWAAWLDYRAEPLLENRVESAEVAFGRLAARLGK